MKTNVTVSDNIPANFSEEPTEAPEEPTEAPEEPTEAPEEPTEAPEEPTEAPEEPTEAPEEPTEAPEEPTEAPEEPTEAPVEPTENPEDCSVKCVQPWDVPEYHANPYDCKSFYQCSNGVPYLHRCPSILVFNPNLNVCDWPSNYQCQPRCSSEGGGPCDVACVQPWDVPEYHANPFDCKSFYQCSNGVPYLHDCPSVLVFNPNLNVCDWPRDYQCSIHCFDNFM